MTDIRMDREDGHLIDERSWQITNRGYVGCGQYLLHREILRKHGLLTDGMVVDHINGDKLDNRKVNLRCVTQTQNLHNAPTWARNTDLPKNVHMQKGRYFARITVGGVRHQTETFDTVEEANQAILKVRKELNL